MKIILGMIGESFVFAWQALTQNMLRTVLSLLGVTVGVFAIIGVFTVVDSLEKNLKDSFSFLGEGVIYVGKWPYVPDASGEYKWWDFWKRPNPSIEEYKFLANNLKHASTVGIFANRGSILVKNKNNSIGDVTLQGGDMSFKELFELPFEEGRYFTEFEVSAGRNVVIIGYNIAQTFFKNEDPLGKEIKIKNIKYVVIGTLKEEGESFIGIPSNDDNCIIPYNSFRKLYQTGTGARNELSSEIGVKGKEDDIGLVQLENEMRGLIRTRRGLKPKDKDNFALNRPEAIANIIGGLFDVVNLVGIIIGGFSILIGGFGIANIMFVSVKERTRIIGIQKSLGAKGYFILFQFLFEAIFLCVIGAAVGLLLVYVITLIPMGFEIGLSVKNVTIGVVLACGIGVLSGIIPAALAARLDPVIAIRS